MHPTVHRVVPLVFCLYWFLSAGPALAWSPNESSSRRQWLHRALGIVSAGISTSASAACLPGDLSKECIGVYKVPIDDNILPYVGTPEALQRFAPDLKYVPPTVPPSSTLQAWQMLESQRLAADDIQQVVASGRLEEAGIKVLNLLPKVTQAGRMLVAKLDDELTTQTATGSSSLNEVKMTRITNQLDMALGLWGECDVMIGQGLRGEMGVSAVAQLQILSSLKDATCALDDFMATAAKAGSSIAKR